MNVNPQNPYNLILSEFVRGNRRRELIATIDLSDGNPSLVKSSVISETHHQSTDIQECYEYLSVFDKVVMVNLDGALDMES